MNRIELTAGARYRTRNGRCVVQLIRRRTDRELSLDTADQIWLGRYTDGQLFEGELGTWTRDGRTFPGTEMPHDLVEVAHET